MALVLYSELGHTSTRHILFSIIMTKFWLILELLRAYRESIGIVPTWLGMQEDAEEARTRKPMSPWLHLGGILAK